MILEVICIKNTPWVTFKPFDLFFEAKFFFLFLIDSFVLFDRKRNSNPAVNKPKLQHVISSNHLQAILL